MIWAFLVVLLARYQAHMAYGGVFVIRHSGLIKKRPVDDKVDVFFQARIKWCYKVWLFGMAYEVDVTPLPCQFDMANGPIQKEVDNGSALHELAFLPVKLLGGAIIAISPVRWAKVHVDTPCKGSMLFGRAIVVVVFPYVYISWFVVGEYLVILAIYHLK